MRGEQDDFTGGVPARYVHRTAGADVLLTGWRRSGQDAFVLHARWPAEHSLLTPVCGRWHDPVLVAETVRQAGMLISHAEYCVPMDRHFLMHELDFAVDPVSLPSAGRAAQFDLHFSGHEVRQYRGSLSSMRYTVDLVQHGRLVGNGGARFSCVTPAAYRRLRGARAGSEPDPAPPVPAAPRSVGRARATEVVLLAEDTAVGRWWLRLDPRHPTLVDHPVDHVPGMLLVEAARQAAEAVTSPGQVLPLSLTSTFHRYAEYQGRCWIQAERGPTDARGVTVVHVTSRQDDHLVFDATLTVQQYW